MPLPDPASQARLAAMGIETWARRVPAERAVGVDAVAKEARVRLASGDGSWLLVQRRAWDGSQSTLVADITALLGADQCRFGQWSSGGSAGLAVSELAARGIVNVLAFGPLPDKVDAPDLIQAPALDEIAVSAHARRRLWMALRPALAS
ncbi:MAG: hypothetical protein ACOCVP_02480 [Wenzhouxiangella sp.]